MEIRWKDFGRWALDGCPPCATIRSVNRKETLPAVRTAGVAYRYPQNGAGLAPLSFSAAGGDFVLVTGPSGCGKSTLARCLTGLIPHLYRGILEGEIWIGDARTATAPLWQLAERAGLVFQNPAAQMLSLAAEDEIIFGLENLGLDTPTIAQRLETTLAHFELEPLRKRSPQTLSGGEQQKLALASITARQPALLVLDEPLSMLDGTVATALVNHLMALAQEGTTIVVCEHREAYLRDVPNLRTLRLAPPKERAALEFPGGSGDAECGATEHRDRPPDFRLVVEDLTVQLGGRPILHNLSFSAGSGAIVAVVGRNGVGKTTLLRALAGLQAQRGRVTIVGDPQGTRPDFGIAFQNPDVQIFNPTVREEILYRVPDPDHSRYTWLLAMLGLTRYEATPPLLLSEGEKKRVGLATVVMRGPRHGVLLDEPSLGQDAVHKQLLVRLLRALADAGQLVILTTHDLPLAAQADRLLLLGSGGIVASGPPAEVLRAPAPWARLGLTVPDWVLEGGEATA